jgi:type IV fimbrial biogenesis protein FimT
LLHLVLIEADSSEFNSYKRGMKRVHTGFTLVELMITLAVGVIILAAGIPAFTSMMSSNEATAIANDFTGALRLARSEAVKRGAGVTVCASNANHTACDGDHWENGWLVFTDPDDDRAYSASDDLIRIWQAPEGGISFTGAPTSIRFLASGRVSGIVSDFAFQLSNCSGKQARTIKISKMGRTEINHSACL